MTGRTISHYEVQERLGGGGMGVVYRAVDTRLGRPVALKFLPSYLSSDLEAKQRFMQEAKAASALDHSGICNIHEIAETDEGELYIVMAFYDGQTLKARLSEGPLPVELALDIARQLARALARAHESDIIHRDVKPANVMLTDRGEVKLLDFGLAKLAGGAELTRPGSTLGTAAYMSPEQVRSEPVGRASDIWSWGVVLYEMLTGRRPFAGEYEQAISFAILNEEPEPIRELRPEVPDNVSQLVTDCLSRNADARPASMADVLTSLGEEAPVGLRSRSPYVTAAAVIVAAIVLAMVMWRIASREATPSSTPDFVLSPVTQHLGPELVPQLSPDGGKVAYYWSGPRQDSWDVYVQEIGSATPVRLTSDTLHEGMPAWSPDGTQIAFLRWSREDGEWMADLQLVSAAGGLERNVGTLVRPLWDVELAFMWSPVWHPDGGWVVGNDADSAGLARHLVAVSLQSGEKRRLTTAGGLRTSGGHYGDRPFGFSDDGSLLLFGRLNSWVDSHLFVLSFGEDMQPAGPPREVARGRIWGAALTAGGEHIIYSEGKDALWRLSLEPGSSPTYLDRIEGIREIGISRRGKRLVFAKETAQRVDIWRVDLSAPETAANRNEVLIASTGRNDRPEYSPDGRQIAFISNRSGTPEIWISANDGSNPLQLTELDGCWNPSWSPDGRRLAAQCHVGGLSGQADIYVVSTAGGVPEQLTTHPADDMSAAWSPDGEWIYFQSEREGKEHRIWRIRTAGTDPEQLTTGPGGSPKPSADGRYVYFHRGGDIWRMAPAGGGEELVHEVVDGWAVGDIALMDDALYFLHREQAGLIRVRRLDLADGTLATVFVPESGRSDDLSISPDGRFLLYEVWTPPTSDIWMIEDLRLD